MAKFSKRAKQLKQLEAQQAARIQQWALTKVQTEKFIADRQREIDNLRAQLRAFP